MIFKTELFILVLLTVVAVHTTQAALKCNCQVKRCATTTNCKFGTHKDSCGCCDICAKGEGELCGGEQYNEGECGDKLQCMVRQIKDNRNLDKKNVGELVGRCEYIPCHYKSCPFGQLCTMVKDVPTCTCPKCKDMIMSPVCGELDGKTYANECELRQAECLQGREIRMINGPCKASNSSRVICRDDGMRIEIIKSFIGKNLSKKKITLLDSACVFQSNATHLYIDTKLNECGTKSNFALTSVIYSNTIRTGHDTNAVIIRNKNSVQIPVECFYSVTGKASNKVEIASRGEIGNRVEEKLRNNGIGVHIKSDNQRNSRSASVENDVRVNINRETKYVVVLQSRSLKALKSNVILFPKFCYATPADRKYRWMRYTLIENGCPVDDSVEIRDSKAPFIRLQIPGIEFQGTKVPGYLVRCKIHVCIPRDPSKNQTCMLPRCRKNQDTNKDNFDNENILNVENNDVRKRSRRRRAESFFFDLDDVTRVF